MFNISDDRVLKIREWFPVSEADSSDNAIYKRNDEYGTHGVYQVALKSDIEEIGEDIVHEKIGYTGESKNIHSRIYTIKQPKGSHGAATYIRSNNLNREEVFIRILYTQSDTIIHKHLEKDIHDKSADRFGFRFAWQEASGGVDGLYLRMVSDLEKLSSEQMLDFKKDLEEAFFDKVKQENLEKWEEA